MCKELLGLPLRYPLNREVEMNKQVEELVEWVANGIEVNMCRACGCTGEECEGCTWLIDAKGLARQILSHPDLALITTTYITYPESGAKMAKVIPLASALKEVEKC